MTDKKKLNPDLPKDMSIDSRIEAQKRITRREALTTAGKAAIGLGGAVIVAGAAYVAYTSLAPSTPATVTSTETATTTATSEVTVVGVEGASEV